MRDSLRISIVQMTSTNRHDGNIEEAGTQAAHAASEGCELLALPEAAGMMNRHKDDVLSRTTTERDDPFIAACREYATRFGIWIHVGSTPIQENGLLLNHAVLIDDAGRIRARYNKIHLFDIFLGGREFRESERYAAGTEAVVVDTPWGPWGLSICYDVRFPHLYRDYAKCGARVMFVPSAFTVPTGRAHWEPLLRARAIENGCWIVAAAQTGNHDDGRVTYGHSLVVNPWGEVVADLGETAPKWEVVDLDLSLVESLRRQIPSLLHERPYQLVRRGEPEGQAVGEPT